MPYPNEHAARVKDPSIFEPDSFRSKNLNNGIRIIMGKLKGGTSMVTQAYRFPIDKFTVEQAKKWLEDNKIKFIKFESASGGESMDENLQHAGVMGMRWGFRNKRDMPGESGGKIAKAKPTAPEKKKRDMPGESGGKKFKKMSPEAEEALKLKKMGVHELSNEQLQKLNKRMELEKRFKDLNPDKATRGKKKVDAIFSTVSKTAGVIGSVAILAGAGKKVFDFAMKRKVALKAARAVADYTI